jgi:hypothetical protein
MKSSDFVRMLYCYVLVNFAGRRCGNGGDMMEGVGVVRDVIYLAENQIPFFVVHKIHKLTIPDAGAFAADAIAGYVQELLRGKQYSVATQAVGPVGVDSSSRARQPSSSSLRTAGNKVTGKQRPFCRWRSATLYYYAGVGFRSRPLVGKGARSILDVKLDGRGGTLEIPRLKTDADTSRLLRNLMALEQSNPTEAGSHVTAYCVFLLVLARDHRARPRQPRRGRRRKGVAFDLDGSYLCATWQGLDDWAAWLMLRYSSNPWLPVAAVGLVCTVVQSVYAVLSYTPNACENSTFSLETFTGGEFPT